jgi:hypothetical protein
MIRCDECLRANPPTRVQCLYCGVALPMTESAARLRKPVLRPPEKHQPAFSNILLPDQPELSTDTLAEAAGLLKLSAESLQKIMAEKLPLPVAFTASRDESELVVHRLGDLGVKIVALGDDELGVSSVKRVKGMTLAEDSLTFQHFSGWPRRATPTNEAAPSDDTVGVVLRDHPSAGTTETIHVSWRDVVLIVTGRLFVKRMEIQERKTRRPENEIVQSSEFFSDEAVLDLYTSTDAHTWRVSANGFDFSCLGGKKALIANENISRLQTELMDHAPQAKLDDSYRRLRHTLDLVWTAQQETQSSGWRRERPGKLSIGVATINSNESQFTRYSRLVRYFYLKASTDV